jgi:hypothetical protein
MIGKRLAAQRVGKWHRLPNMMIEDANSPGRRRRSFVEYIRGKALDCIPEVQKLCFSFIRHRTFSASKLVQRCAADLALDDGGQRFVNHREFERHPAGIVANYPAPSEWHGKPLTPSLGKLRPFAGVVERMWDGSNCQPTFGLAASRNARQALCSAAGDAEKRPRACCAVCPVRSVSKCQIHVHHERVRTAAAVILTGLADGHRRVSSRPN